jgi:hypothetical protein
MNKSTLIAVLVFAALAAAAVVTLREKPQHGMTRISFTGVDPAAVDRIVIKGPHPIELTRTGETWTVDGKRADATAVKNLLDTVKLVESADVVTRNRDRFAALEVDDEKGTQVQAFSGGARTVDFVIGTAAAGGSHVRAGDTVYLVKRVFKGSFARERSAWLDRTLFADNANDATQVEVKLAAQAPYVLTKAGEEWKPEDAPVLPAGFRFDGNAARSLVSALVSAQAKDVLDEDPGDATTGLGESADVLVLHLASGDPRTLRIGAKKDAGGVYARVSTRPDLVTIPEYVAKNLRKPLTDLRDLSLMAFDANAAKRLEIVKDKDRLVFEKDGEAWKVAASTPAAPSGFQLDPLAVTRRLSAVGSLRAVADAETDVPAKAGLDKPSRTVNVTLADDRVATLAFGKDTKWDNADAAYARGNADGKIYVVRASARDNALGGLDTFAKRPETPPLANINPQALGNLPPEVRENLLKQLAQQKQRDALLKKAMEQQGKKETQ